MTENAPGSPVGKLYAFFELTYPKVLKRLQLAEPYLRLSPDQREGQPVPYPLRDGSLETPIMSLKQQTPVEAFNAALIEERRQIELRNGNGRVEPAQQLSVPAVVVFDPGLHNGQRDEPQALATVDDVFDSNQQKRKSNGMPAADVSQTTSDEKRETKARRRKNSVKKFSIPDGYERRALVILKYPDVPPWTLKVLLRNVQSVHGGQHGSLINEVAAQNAVEAWRIVESGKGGEKGRAKSGYSTEKTATKIT